MASSLHFVHSHLRSKHFIASRAATQKLELGKSLKRQIIGSEKHHYSFQSVKNQFVNVKVKTRDSFVTIELVSPDGRVLTKSADFSGAWGEIRLLYIAEETKDYQLQIEPADKTAPLANCEIILDELHFATPADSTRLVAEQTYLNAYQLDEEQRVETSQQALALYRKVLRLFREINARAAEAVVLYKIGWLERDIFGNLPQALESFNQSLSIWRELKDRAWEAQLLNFIGATDSYQGDYQKAIDEKTEALKILREIKLLSSEGYTLHEFGYIYSSLGEYQKALDYYEQALTVYQKIGNKKDLARTLANIGSVYNFLGEQTKAIDYFQQALTIERAGNDRVGQPQILINLGTSYESLGDTQKPLDYYQQAELLAREIGYPRKEAAALVQIGRIRQSFGKQPQSFEYFNRALSIFRTLNDKSGEAQTLNYLGNACVGLGNDASAAEFYNQALTINRNIKDRAREAETLYFYARLEYQQNKLKEALDHLKSAIEFVEKQRNELTSNDLRTSFFANVRNYYELRTNILMRLHKMHPASGYNALGLESAEGARARNLLELLRESRIHIGQGIESKLLEREKTLRQILSAKTDYQTRLFANKRQSEQAAALTAEIKKLSEDYQQTQVEIRQKSPRYAALTQPTIISVKQMQTAILDRDTILLEYSLNAENSYLWVVEQNSLNSYELPKQTEIEMAARRVYKVLTARNQNLGSEIETDKRARIEKAESQFADAAASLSEMIFPPAVIQQLKNKRLLIVADGALQYVPFGALKIQSSNSKVQSLKIKEQTTNDEKQFLIESNEIVLLPSASTLAVLRAEKKLEAEMNSIAVVADPVFAVDDARVLASAKTFKNPVIDLSQTTATRNQNLSNETMSVARAGRESGLNGFPRLRFSRDEADGIAAIAQRQNLMKAVDFAANKQTVVGDEFGKHRIIHFATHGLINSQNPELSGIVLSLVDENGNPRNGFLRLFEIYNLKLESDLVVLSACQTALGKEVKGEGLIGLTRGFMYAGAPRVVASLWSVHDRATAELMRRFYQKMLGENLRPAAALRAAQVEMGKNRRFSSPYYWAAFILQGEWR